MAINTTGHTDVGQICQNCADVFTEALENFSSLLVEEPVRAKPLDPDDHRPRPRRQRWTTKG